MPTCPVPPVNTVVARRGGRRDELIYYSDLSVSEEGQQGGSAAGKDKAVVTNEGISQRYGPASCIFYTKTCRSTQTGAMRCGVACLGINGVCKAAGGGQAVFYKAMAT